jgi:hypothetical protein
MRVGRRRLRTRSYTLKPMRTVLTLTLAICTAPVVGIVQQAINKEPDRAELLQGLRSDKVDERVSAFEKLRGDSSALQDSDVKAALTDLLDRENHVDIKDDDEGYVEYVDNLIGTVTKLIEWSDQRQVCILVRSAYPPRDELAAHVLVAMRCLLEKAQSKSGLARGYAVAILVQALGSDTIRLDASTVQKFHQVILAALHDQAYEVRWLTLRALKSFGQEDMIPTLKQVAETDPGPPSPDGYELRRLATEAIAAIQKRSGRN